MQHSAVLWEEDFRSFRRWTAKGNGVRQFFGKLVFVALALAGAQSASSAVVLPQLNPTVLDTTYQSSDGAAALIQFVNLEPFAVDIYWINYMGDRVFYNTIAIGGSYFQGTFITHPWIAAEFGSGDTLTQGTGLLLDGFLAQTVNLNQTTALADIAYIGLLPSSVPEPSVLLLSLAGGAAFVSTRSRKKNAGSARTA